MKSVMVFGTFDHLHKGHRYFLERAAKKGSQLTAVVSTDTFVIKNKGKKPHHPQQKRMLMLQQSRLVNKVLPSDYPVGQWQVIEQERPAVICLGHDQVSMKSSLEEWISQRSDEYSPEIIMLDPYRRSKYSSSRISKLKKMRTFTLLLFAMLLWGYSWVSGKEASSITHPMVLVFWRFLISSIAFLPLIFMRQKRDGQLKMGMIWTAGASICLIIYNFLFFKGLDASLAGKGGVMVTSLVPLFTLLISAALLKKQILKKEIAGLFFGLAGGILLVEPWLFSVHSFLESSNLLFIIAAFTFAVITHLSHKAQQHLGVMEFNFFLYTGATLAALLICRFYGVNPFEIGQWGWTFWGNILFLALGAGALATALYFRAGLILGPSHASSFTFIVPGAALLFSALRLQEYPSILMLTATLFSSTAIYLINKKVRQHNA